MPQKYVLYSGFQYRYDPGVPLVGIGAFVLLAGLIISFYFLPARLYVRVDSDGSAPLERRHRGNDRQGIRRFRERVRAVGGSVEGERYHELMPATKSCIAIALGAYTLGALALIVYFFSRRRVAAQVGMPLAILGCVAQFAQLAVRFETTDIWPLLNLYGSLSLFSAMSVAIYIVFAFRYQLWFAGGFVLALAAILLAYGVTWNEGTCRRCRRCNRTGRRSTCRSSSRRTPRSWCRSSSRASTC